MKHVFSLLMSTTLFFGSLQAFTGSCLTLFKAAPYALTSMSPFVPGLYEQQQMKNFISTLDKTQTTMNELIKNNDLMKQHLKILNQPKKSSGCIRTGLACFMLGAGAAAWAMTKISKN